MKINSSCAQISGIFRALIVLLFFSVTGFADYKSNFSIENSPYAMQFSHDNQLIAVSDATASKCFVINVENRKIQKSISLKGSPKGVVWKSNDRILVSEYDNGTLAEIDMLKGSVIRRIAVGPKPVSIVAAKQKQVAFVTEFGLSKVYVVDLKSNKIIKIINTPKYPYACAISSDERTLVVGHLINSGKANTLNTASLVTIIDICSLKVRSTILLPDGSTNVRNIAISSDGKWAYICHTRGRYAQLTSMLDRGWINTNAFSIVNLQNDSLYTTMIIDRPSKGSADPWGITVDNKHQRLWLTASGTHEILEINLSELHDLLDGTSSILTSERGGLNNAYSGTAFYHWSMVKKFPDYRATLVNNLNMLDGIRLIKRHFSTLRGPRDIQCALDGSLLAVCGYYSGNVAFYNTHNGQLLGKIELNSKRNVRSSTRIGEEYFHDATRCFQSWLSCASCHPEGRADGLNWDLLNDGIGNPKNVKTMVLAPLTPPSMAHGIRSTYDVAIRAGFKHIQFATVDSLYIKSVAAYIQSLTPELSPYLIGKKFSSLSKNAQRGKKLFESNEIGCAKCHPTPLYTDCKLHTLKIGDDSGENELFDTPSLLESWRTAPYLHDGSATQIRDVIIRLKETKYSDRLESLSDEEIDLISEFVLSL